MTRETEKREENASPRVKPKRKPRGRPFAPGNKASPGRPKKDFDLVTRCRELTPDIIERYAEMGANAKSAADVMAGRVVVEYGYDKPRQRVEATGKDGAPLTGATVLLVLPDDESGPDEPAGGAATGESSDD